MAGPVWLSFKNARPQTWPQAQIGFRNVPPGETAGKQKSKNKFGKSQVLQQLFECDPGLFQNRLQCLWPNLTVHWNTGMMRAFGVMPVRTSLTPEFKTQAR